MKIITPTTLDPSFFKKGSVLTLGNFDGIHIGHQTLLKRISEWAKKEDLPSVVVTYSPNPAVVLGSRADFKYLMDESEKIRQIQEFGIDCLMLLEFNIELSKMSAEDFLKDIIIGQLNAKHIVIGFNHFFGANRRGNVELLREYSEKYQYGVELFETSSYNGEKVSSSLIRKCLEQGEVFKASKLLGRPFSYSGEVVEGEKRGRLLGYPTANIKPKADYLLPAAGVYAGTCQWDDQFFKAMINIGSNPTFADADYRLEAHLFGFEGDLYNKRIQIHFYQKLRNEQKFDGADSLKAQLDKDKQSSLQILEKMI